MTAPELESWRPLAVSQGVNSYLILPIKKAGEVIGTFNLYATEINFFNKEEIELLLEVTEDVSFTLDNLDKTRKQKEAESKLKETEMLFRAMTENSLDMKTLSTKEGKLLYGSPSIFK